MRVRDLMTTDSNPQFISGFVWNSARGGIDKVLFALRKERVVNAIANRDLVPRIPFEDFEDFE